MHGVIGMLGGVFLSGAVSLCLGLILFRWFRIQLERRESLCLGFVAGSACFSHVIFMLSSIHQARRGAFIGVALLAALVTLTGIAPMPIRFAALPRRWKWFALTLFASFGIVYLVSAMAPERSPDAAAYHLPLIVRYLHAHGFERIDNFYAGFPQGIELLFLPAVSVGGYSSAALVHFLFLLDLPLLMVCYGRRFGFPLPAMTAAFLVFASPVVGWDGTSAYVDVALATVLFALFYVIQIWDCTREPNLLLVIGILAGFAYAVKYTGAIAIAYAAGFIGWRLWRGRKAMVRPILTVISVSAVFILPWMFKNTLLIGNPIAPFANHLFPNPYVHVSFEREYETYLRHYHLTNRLSAPWELAVKGERLQGFFGPVFLLMPLALFSLRRRSGRRILFAAAIFALPWFLNIGSRFLIPALPLLALALAFAAERPWMLAAIMLFHGFLSWYASPLRYFDRYAPRIDAVPLKAAFRIETEDAYLARREPGYLVDRMIEGQAPPGSRVFALEPIPEAWTTREIMTRQTAAANEVLADVLQNALVASVCPMQSLALRFPPTLLRRIRAIQTSRLAGEMWSVSEFQLLEGGKPLAPNGKWRMRASVNPWDVPLAFDGSLVTRWRSWEDAVPGMFLDVDFGEARLVDEARLIISPDALRDHVDLAGMDTSGEWHNLAAVPLVAPVPITGNLRQEAIRQLTTRGIGYLLVTPFAFGANDFNENADVWGVRFIAESEGARLYGLEPDRAVAASIHESPEAPVPAGAYDDADPRVRLLDPWTRDPQFQDAYRHTLTYSDIPGASATLAFSGDAITYVYTRASNRGIAEVRIDGQLKDEIDLYAPATAWQSRRRYGELGPGAHVLEIRVTGQRNSRATGCFVDLDALIVEK